MNLRNRYNIRTDAHADYYQHYNTKHKFSKGIIYTISKSKIIYILKNKLRKSGFSPINRVCLLNASELFQEKGNIAFYEYHCLKENDFLLATV